MLERTRDMESETLNLGGHDFFDFTFSLLNNKHLLSHKQYMWVLNLGTNWLGSSSSETVLRLQSNISQKLLYNHSKTQVRLEDVSQVTRSCRI